MQSFSDDDIARILLEHQLIHTAREICDKWGIKASTLASWKKRFAPWRRGHGLRELVIVALLRGCTTPSNMIPLLDYLDHAIYSEEELLAVLRELETEGIAVRSGDVWSYDRSRLESDRPFVF